MIAQEKEALLRNSFIQLPGVGAITERAMWNAGICAWDDVLESPPLPQRVRGRLASLQEGLEECRRRLDDRDGAYFQSHLPPGERWRLYGDFRERAAFLDIETTGLSPRFNHITLVGILDSEGYHAYIREENLEDLRSALEPYDLIVTFNGAAFDLPFIEYHFGRVFRRHAHLDLRFPLKRLGYGGGLKRIERRLQVGRPSELSGLDGFDAVLMWRMWLDGDTGARDTLIRYNAEDVGSLPLLADLVYDRMQADMPVPRHSLERWPHTAAALPYGPDVIRRLSARKGSGV